MEETDEEIRLANKETGPHALRIYNPDLILKLKTIILNHWHIVDKEKDFFPAPQPVSLERRDLYKLCDFEYLVCAKSDGMRFLLVCYSGKAFMVDRAFKFYQVKLNFDNNKLYNCDDFTDKLGGIFDGELVQNKQGKWQYVIHDCIDIHGLDISRNMFPMRNNEIIRFISDIWINTGSEFRITSKQFFNFNQLGLLNRLILENKLDHKTDGLIFTPKNKRVGSHTQYDLFKWKPRELHTFDFKINIHDEGVTAFVNKNSVHEAYASAPKGSKEEEIFIHGLTENCPDFVNNSIVECDYDEHLDTYKPIKLRLDKTHPNSLFTVKKTLNNIKENITVDELIDLGNPPV